MGLFLVLVLSLGFSTATISDCKKDGLDVKQCASKVWKERKAEYKVND